MDIIDTTPLDTVIIEDQDKFNPNEVNTKSKYYPCCVCWSSIPFLTWMIPIIGHAAISDPNGWIYDFQSSYSIGKHRQSTCFGRVRKYIKLDVKVSEEEYNQAIEHANEKFSKLTHNLVVQNCHDHVCVVLNDIGYRGRHNWNTFSLILLLMFKSKYVSAGDAILTYLPFCLFIIILLLFVLFFVFMF